MRNHRPVIGISTDFEYMARPSGRQRDTAFIYQTYYQFIRERGGVPLLIPPTPAEDLEFLKKSLDGILLSGGDDLDPALFGEEPLEEITLVHPVRQGSDLALAGFADREGIPILGICLGAQVLNVIRQGDIFQDIPTQVPEALPHKNPPGEGPLFHEVEIPANARLREIVNQETLKVNSFHHQSIRKVGKGLQVNARSRDGIIEGVEAVDHPFFMAFQWHLELNTEEQPWNRTILDTFLDAAAHHSMGQGRKAV